MSYDNDDSIEDDEIVAELDVYSCSNVLPPTAPAYLLQFPQRTQRRPYEGVKDVRFKPKVKRLQWSVPLDTQAATYNSDVDQPMQLQSFTLQSDRIDPGMQGLAVAMRRGSRLYLVPVQEVLQLRHSPVYLDAKEKEAPRRAAGGGGPEALSGIETKPAELPPITVQVKSMKRSSKPRPGFGPMHFMHSRKRRICGSTCVIMRGTVLKRNRCWRLCLRAPMALPLHELRMIAVHILMQ